MAISPHTKKKRNVPPAAAMNLKYFCKSDTKNSFPFMWLKSNIFATRGKKKKVLKHFLFPYMFKRWKDDYKKNTV